MKKGVDATPKKGATVKKGVTAKQDKQDTIKGQQRYVDQPGQWVDTTPKAVKARQDKALKAFAASVNKKKATPKKGK